MPVFDIPQAREALLDCVMRLERRSLEAEKQAVSAQLATREEEVGSTALMNAALEESNDVIARELAELQLRDLETGLKLHGRERNDGRQAVGTDIDG